MRMTQPLCFVIVTAMVFAGWNRETTAEDILRIGIIGLDTSHAGAFTNILNDKNAAEDVAGCRVVAAYPKGSPDIPSSTSRVPKYTEDMRKRGVEIVDSIDELLTKVDCVLLETNDGRPHLEQLLPCLKAGKRTFVDKPIAGSLTDAVAMFAARGSNTTRQFFPLPLCDSAKTTQAARKRRVGKNHATARRAVRHRSKRLTPIYFGTAFMVANRCSP